MPYPRAIGLTHDDGLAAIGELGHPACSGIWPQQWHAQLGGERLPPPARKMLDRAWQSGHTK